MGEVDTLREKKKTHRRFDSRNRPRRFPAPRSRVLTVRFATGGRPGSASSTQKAGKRTVPSGDAFVTPTTRRFGTRSFQERATSMNLATHGLRAAVGFPPRVMRRAGGNTPRRALAVRAEITRIRAPDGSVERRGVTFKTPVPFDAAAAKTGIMHVGVGGFHRAHQLVRAPRKSPRAHPGDARGETAHGERGGHRLELDRSISDTCASIAIRGTLCGPWRTSPVSWSALAGRSARRQVGLHFCGFSRQEGVSAVPCETERSQSRDF